MNKSLRERGPRIKPMIKKLIAGEAIEYSNKPRLALAVELKDKINRMGEIPPSEETLIKMISAARNKEPRSFDTPWHLGLKDSITPDALEYILQAQDWLEGLPQHEGVPPPQRILTIKQAQWISRLYGAVNRKPAAYTAGEYLYRWADWYASYEWICEISSTSDSFETSNFDNKLRKGDLPYQFDSVTETIYADGNEFSVTKLLEQIEKEGENNER